MKLLSGVYYFEELDDLPYLVVFPNGAPMSHCYNICMSIAEDIKVKMEAAAKQAKPDQETHCAPREEGA